MTKAGRRIGCLFFLVLLIWGAIGTGKWMLHTVYPMHYGDLIEKYAAIYELDPYLVAAIIKNESKFNPDAVSRKDARGLMQIAPVTGEWAASELPIENYEIDRLHEPELNIQIGTWFLTVLQKQFGDRIQVILAAYNAGNGNVSKWLADSRYSGDGQTLREIPFPETSAYVVKVQRDYERYRLIYEEGFFAFLRSLI